MSAKTTKKASEMRAEYDFSKGVRGKYAERYRESDPGGRMNLA